MGLKFVFPHHAFYWHGGSLVVFGVFLIVVVMFDVSIYTEVDELTYGHARIDSDGMGTGNFQGPGIAEAHIAFSRSGVDVYTESSDAGFSFQEGDGAMGFGVFQGYTQVEGVGVEYKTRFGDFEVFYGVVFACIEDMVFVDGQRFSEVHIVGVGSQFAAVEGLDDDFSVGYAFEYFFVAQDHLRRVY